MRWSTTANNSGGATIKTEPGLAAPTVTVYINTQITVSFTTVTTSPPNGGEAVTN
jgi:hypothetical protein